jgi:homoserine kinase
MTKKVTLRVPGTTANLGPGFDALGLALQVYNTFTFEIFDNKKGLFFEGVPMEFQNKDHLVYKSMVEVFNRLDLKPDGLKITVDSCIPMSRGLGSSAACIVGGIFGANALFGNQLSTKELFNLATELEGHPDNVAPAIFGGITVSSFENGKSMTVVHCVHPKYDFHCLIPDFSLSTSDARNVLPKQVDFKDATFNLSKATLTYLALYEGYDDILAESCKDRLHQPYRSKLINNYDDITKKVIEYGGLATCLSGAGPTILVISLKENKEFIPHLKKYLETLEDHWQMKDYQPDHEGVTFLS